MRPHDALDGKTPADLYKPSDRKLREPRPFAYPRAFLVRRVDRTGHVSCHGDKPYAGLALRGQRVGFERLEGLRWRLWFHDLDLGYIELLPEWFDRAALEDPTTTAVINEKKLNESTETAA